jgi:hypothetical protein
VAPAGDFCFAVLRGNFSAFELVSVQEAFGVAKRLGMGRPMGKAVLVAVIAILLSRVATADVVRHGSIPEAYTGRWIAGTETEPNNSVIVLSPKMYVSPEATCSVD